MKKILFICLIIISTNSFSQSYHKFLDSNVFWDVGYAEMGYICQPYGSTLPSRFSISGDTTINLMTYTFFKSYSYINLNVQPAPNCPPFAIDTIPYQINTAIMREDTSLKKVYKYDVSSQQELLWYDFNAQQGDTLFYGSNPYFIVDTIYNIITLDGKTRKYFEYNNNMGGGLGGYYIEGLGGRGGPFSIPLSYFEAGSWLMCISDTNQNTIYSQNSCYSFITGIDNKFIETSNISINPNPVSDYFTIDTEIDINEINILDISGKSIKSIIQTSTKAFSVSDLPSGIYFVKVIGKKHTIIRKIIKQ
ncbi:MAG: hypothetical protein COB15_11100 [Flavobacteriales bacterium]|nr:MAG: hypothetical protein COB15_11100 [Flavobacteriales bacterium]